MRLLSLVFVFVFVTESQSKDRDVTEIVALCNVRGDTLAVLIPSSALPSLKKGEEFYYDAVPSSFDYTAINSETFFSEGLTAGRRLVVGRRASRIPDKEPPPHSDVWMVAKEVQFRNERWFAVLLKIKIDLDDKRSHDLENTAIDRLSLRWAFILNCTFVGRVGENAKPRFFSVTALDIGNQNQEQSVVADAPPENGLHIEYHKNGRKKSETHYKNGEREGLRTEWYDNGQKESEGHYKSGKQDGLQTQWYENGKKHYETHYKNGEPDGLTTWWHENGQKEQEGHWKNGEQNGLWTEWYENGQKEVETQWKNSRKDGLVTEWYENGKKERETH